MFLSKLTEGGMDRLKDKVAIVTGGVVPGWAGQLVFSSPERVPK